MEGVLLLLIFAFYMAIRLLFWLTPDERKKDRKRLKTEQNLVAARQYDQAVVLLSRFLSNKPKSIEALLTRAKCYYELEEPLLALADCCKATNLDNHLPQAYLIKGKAFFMMGHLEEALTEFDKAAWYDRESAEPITWRGLVWRRLGNHRKADADLHVASRMGDENATFYLRKTEHTGIWK